jgi:hypothetical protein
MTTTTEKIAVVALDGAYNVYTHRSSRDVPSAVRAVLHSLPNEIDKAIVEDGMVLVRSLVDVVTTPEGRVIDIRIALQSIGFLAVRTYCLTSGVTPPTLLQVFDDIEDPELCRIINNDEGVYLLPLLGEVV